MKNSQKTIFSKQLEVYLINETNRINREKQLEEIKIFGHDFTMSDIGHGTLDVVSMVSSFFPGYGTAISTAADLSNAAWYYTEGQTFVAGLYTIMAIPIVGDVFAIPIQAALKFGGKGLMKIPLIKKGITHLITNSSFVKGFLIKSMYATEKGGIKSMEKFTGDSVAKFSRESTEKFSKELAENALKLVESIEAKYQKEGVEGVAKFLEEGMLKESQGGAKTLAGKISKEEASQLTKAVIKAEEKVGGKISQEEIKKITTQFSEEVGKRLSKEETEELNKLIIKKLADGSIKGTKKEVSDFIAEWLGKRFGIVAKSGLKRIIPKYGGEAAQSYYDKYYKKDKEDSRIPKPPVSTECPDDNMKKGCKGINIRVIQGYLSNLGYNNPVNGIFDEATEKAVKKLQKDNNLPPADGVVDYLTIAKIEELLTTGKQTKQQLPSPTGPATSAGSSLYENVIRKRNEQIEKLVFKEMVR